MFNIAHVHPVLVHFPLALFPAALFFQAINLVKGKSLFNRDCLSSSALYLIVLAAIAALLAALFGDIALDAARDSGIAEDLMEDHEELGMLSAWLLAGLAVVQGWLYVKKSDSRALSMVFFIAGTVLMGSLILTAWHGGHLVYDLGINVGTK